MLHEADIVMITNFFRVLILLVTPLFLIDILEFIIILHRNYKKRKNMEKLKKFSKK